MEYCVPNGYLLSAFLVMVFSGGVATGILILAYAYAKAKGMKVTLW